MWLRGKMHEGGGTNDRMLYAAKKPNRRHLNQGRVTIVSASP